MNDLSAIIFPDTLPTEQMLIPLVQVFQPLVYLQAAENDPIPQELETALLDELLQQGLCRLVTAVPLGPDRERFLHLVSDLRNRRDDYAAQLGRLSLAGISSSARSREESKSNIVASLLSGGGITEGGHDKKTMLLWQSRLLLKLAEIFDADQARLHREMEKISAKGGDLLAALREEHDVPFSLTEQVATAVPDNGDGTLGKRLRAWSRIFALGNPEPDAPAIFLTRYRDASDLLAEEYENMTGIPPRLFTTLPLPAGYHGRTGLPELTRQMREEGAQLIGEIEELVDGSPNGVGGEDGQMLDRSEGRWQELLAKYFPDGQYGRTCLTLYSLPGVSPQRLFIRAFGLEGDEALLVRGSTAQQRLILGVLEAA